MPQWLLYALASGLFAACTAILAKAGLKDVDSDLATGIRTFFVLIVTWIFVAATGAAKGFSQLSRNNWLFLGLSAIATGLSWLFYYKALQMGKASEVNAIDKGSIIFTVLLAFLFLKEPLTPKVLAGVFLIVTGMVVMIWK